MRVPATGRGIPPDFRSSTRYYWPLDEVMDTDTALDISPFEMDLVDSGFSGITNPNGVTGECRIFDGVDSYLQSSTSETDLTIFSAGYTVHCWFRMEHVPDSGYGDTLVAYSGDLSASTKYARMTMGVFNSSGNYVFRYASTTAAGASLSFIGSGYSLTIGQWYLGSMCVSESGGNTVVTFYLNGEFVQTSTITGVSGGGSLSKWRIGVWDPSFAVYFQGRISHASFHEMVLTQDQIREDFRGGMLWNLDTQVAMRAYVFNEERGTATFLNDIDGNDYIMSATVANETDALCGTATLRLRRSDNLNSLAKFMDDSPLNRYPSPDNTYLGPDETSYASRLEVRDLLIIQAARIPSWDIAQTEDWLDIFYGRVDKIDWGKATIEVAARDIGGDLIDCQIEEANKVGPPPRLFYGSVAGTFIETCLDNQNLLTEAVTGRPIGGSVLTDAPLSTVQFYGAGLNNLVRSGTWTGWTPEHILIVITTAGSPDKFDWYRGGVLQASNVNITGSAQTLFFGLAITFGLTSGHTVGNSWVFDIHPRLWVPTSPGVVLTTWGQDQTNIMDAVNKPAEMIGWAVRWKYDHLDTVFRLQLFQPDRVKSVADYQLSHNDYFDITAMAVDLGDIRNVCTITYPSRIDGTPDQQPTATKEANYPPKEITRTATQAIPGSTSIQRYGRRYMAVKEEASSRIDSLAEATAMADAILYDLSEPRATKSVTMRNLFEIEFNDYVNFKPNDVHYSTEETLAVNGVTHEFNNEGKATTTINLRGKPSGNRRRARGKMANSFYGDPDSLRAYEQESLLHHARHVLKPHLDVRTGDIETGRDSPTTNVVNHRFSTQIRGLAEEPDGWFLTNGVWGASDDAYAESTVVLSGLRSLNLLTGDAVIETDFIPVQKGGWYQASATWQATLAVAGPDLILTVNWYDTNTEAAVILSSDVAFNSSPGADDTWQTNRGEVSADPDSLWAKLEFSRTAVVGESIYIDNVDMQPLKPTSSGVTSSDITNQTANTWVQVTSLDNDPYTAFQDGLYDISAHAMVKVNNGAATHSTSRIKLKKNGSDWKFGDSVSRAAVDDDYVTLRVSALSAPLFKGDVIDVHVIDTENNFDIIGASGESEFTVRPVG